MYRKPRAYSWVQHPNPVTTLWLTWFDDWFDFYNPLIQNWETRPLGNMQAFFARGPNPKWPPTPFLKVDFRTRAARIKFKYIPLYQPRGFRFAIQFAAEISFDQNIQDGRHRHLEKNNFLTRASTISYKYTFFTKVSILTLLLRFYIIQDACHTLKRNFVFFFHILAHTR